MWFFIRIGLAFFIISPIIAGILIALGGIISIICWPNTTEHSSRPNHLGVYLRTKPGKEEARRKQEDFNSLVMRISWIIGVIGALIISFIFIKP